MDVAELTGRQVDAAVAQQVMGWRYDPGLPNDEHGHIQTAFLYPPEWNEELKAWPSTKGRQQQGPYDLVPFYSTDIAAAWVVLEKFQAEQQCIQLKYYKAVRGWQWLCSIGNDSEERDVIAFADTVPDAICRAALKVVEAQP